MTEPDNHRYYVITALLFIGAPAIYFIIVFMPALQNTKKTVGYKEYRMTSNGLGVMPTLMMSNN